MVITVYNYHFCYDEIIFLLTLVIHFNLNFNLKCFMIEILHSVVSIVFDECSWIYFISVLNCYNIFSSMLWWDWHFLQPARKPAAILSGQSILTRILSSSMFSASILSTSILSTSILSAFIIVQLCFVCLPQKVFFAQYFFYQYFVHPQHYFSLVFCPSSFPPYFSISILSTILTTSILSTSIFPLYFCPPAFRPPLLFHLIKSPIPLEFKLSELSNTNRYWTV